MVELPGDLMSCFKCGALLPHKDLDRHLDWHVHVAPVRTAGAQVWRDQNRDQQDSG